MKKLKKFLSIAVISTIAISFAGCGESSEKDNNTNDEQVKISLFIPGQLGSISYFDNADKGMKDAKEKYGDKVDINVYELGENLSDYEPALFDAIDDETDLILTIGWQMKEAIEKVAPQAKDTKFFAIDTTLEFDTYDLENTNSTIFKASEGAFLTGAFASLVSETGTIGFLGGMDDAEIHEFAVAYIEGARYINDDIKVFTSWVGDYADAATGKTMSLSQYNQGADIAFAAAGGSGMGQIQAADETDNWAIGVDEDQYSALKEVSPALADNVATSMVKAIDVAVLSAIDDYMEGNFQGGSTTILGLESMAIYLVENDIYYNLLEEEEQEKLKEISNGIINGDIKVPYSYDMSSEEIRNIINSVNP